MLSGLNEWKTVPEIVRLTFRALSDIVKSHSSILKELEIQIATKANRSELVQKANLTDLNRAFSDPRNNPDTKSIETLYALLEEKVSRKECQYIVSGKFNELKVDIDKKVEIREMHSEIRGLKLLLEENGSKKQIKELLKTLDEKANISDVMAALEEKANKQSIAMALHKKANKSELEALLANKADLMDLRNIASKVETKADLHSLDTLIREISQKMEKNDLVKYIREEFSKKNDLDNSDSVNRIKREIDYKLNHFDKYLETLKNSIEKTQATLSEEIANKIAGDPEAKSEITKITTSIKSDIRKSEEKYNDRILRIDNKLKSLFEEIHDIRNNLQRFQDKESKNGEIENFQIYFSKEIDKLYREIESKNNEFREILESKLDKYEIQNIISETKISKGYSEEIEQTVKTFEGFNKRNFAEIYELVDNLRNELVQKVNTQDLFVFLKNKPDLDEVKEFVSTWNKSNEEKLILEALCSENCTGRWLWKSGDLRSGFSVPWEIESVNTCPENFIWEKDGISIITVTPGLYELFFGFFTGKKPAIQVLVNGETIILGVGGDEKAWGRHRDGNIIGATTTDYIALPSRARLSISYTGPRIVEGFLSLRKL